ncbi:hypothetical protein PybrP1_010687 [[Pythium] brassicae (nom. inval.)]|nr:hypothetical protein PybrP1_010687 [[Pythium] brassicae (nom. inval.)]
MRPSTTADRFREPFPLFDDDDDDNDDDSRTSKRETSARAVMETGNVAAQAGGADTELVVLLSSMCFAVSEDGAAEDAALLELYRGAAWRLAIELELRTLNDWSLANSAARKSSAFTRDIALPALVLASPARDSDDALDKMKRADDADSAPKHPQKRAKVARTTATASIPALFRLTRIAEDPLEARWDLSGRPVPLRCNVLGEPYAPRSRPLQFVTQARAPARVYQQVKRSVRAELADRERRRVQKLNDTYQQQVRAAERSAEQALEAKFDRLFVDNNAPPHGLATPGDSGGLATKRDSNTSGGGESDTDDNQETVACGQ